MNNEMLMSVSVTKFSEAFLNAQKLMEAVKKDSSNPYFKSRYADLNAILAVVKPALNAQGIQLYQPTIVKDNKTIVRTLLLHTSGEWLASEMEVIVSKQNDPQAYGSAVTYARRYSLQALVALEAEDDDAELGMGRGKGKAASVSLNQPLKPSGTLTLDNSGSGTVAMTDATVKTDVTATLTTENIKKTSSFRPPKKTNGATPPASDNSGWE